MGRAWRRAGIAGLALLALAGPGAAQQGPWRLLGELQLAPAEEIGALSLSPGGDRVAGTIMRDGAFVGGVWRLADGKLEARLEGGFPLYALFRFGDGARVFSFDREGLRLWDLPGGPPVADLRFDAELRVNDVIHDPDRGTLLVAQDLGPLLVLDRDGRVGGRIETDAMRPHRQIWLVEGGTRLVVDSEAFTLTARMEGLPQGCAGDACEAAYAALPGAYGPYEELAAVDPQSGRFATLPPVDPARAGQQDGVFRPVATPSLRIWQGVEDWAPADLPMAELPLGEAPVRVEFSAGGTLLLAVTTGGEVTLWDVASGGQRLALRHPPGDWYAEARFIPGSKLLFLRTGLGRAFALQIGDGAVVQDFPEPNTEVVFTPDGRRMITAQLGAGPARIWQR